MYIEPWVVAGGASGEVLLLGRYNAVFDRTSSGQWAPAQGDSLMGALVVPGEPAVVIPAPVPTAVLEGIRAARRPDGSWDVVFAELQPSEGEARSRLSRNLWHGVLAGGRWTALERIAAPPGQVERVDVGSSLVRWGDSLAWAVPHLGSGGESGLLLLTRRDGEPWRHEVLGIRHAYSELMHDAVAGLVLAVVQPDPHLMVDGNSLLFWTRNPEWKIHGTVVPGARERVHHPRLANSGTGAVLTWEAQVPRGDGRSGREAHAMVGQVALRNEPVIRLDSAVVPMRPITHISLGNRHFWLLEHRGEAEPALLRLVGQSAGPGTVVTEFPTPYASAVGGTATSDSELVISGGVVDDTRSFVATVLLGLRVECVPDTAALATVAGEERASAQGDPFSRPEGVEHRIQITLMLSASGQPAMILRRRSEPQNVILLDANATEQQLSDAVFTLLAMEARDPNGRDRSDGVAQSVQLDPHAPVYPWSGAAIMRLRAAEKRQVPGMGERRSVDIWVRPVRPHPPTNPSAPPAS